MSDTGGSVYLVTSGDYSDYGVDGVFSSRERAQEYIDRARDVGGWKWGEPDIEEWPLDPHLRELRAGRRLYGLCMDKSGDVDWVRMEGTGEERVYWSLFGNMVCYVWAKSEEHAIKIANERRVQALAVNEWPKRPATTGSVAQKVRTP